MTRKDFEAVAQEIRHVRIGFKSNYANDRSRMVLDALADNLANVFSEDNPRFDRAKFLLACGVKPA